MTKATNFFNFFLLLTGTQAFLAPSPSFASRTRLSATKHRDDETSFLMKEFTTAKGEVVNPYRILKTDRSASRQDIKKSYYKLSRKYHPDSFRHQKILPGSCNTEQDVLDHWERIRLSYEILSSPKMRLRYDRNEFLADPGAAMQRAALNAIGKGLQHVGKGCVSFGIFAVKHMVHDTAVVATALTEQVKKDIHIEELVKQKVAESVQGLVSLESFVAKEILFFQPASTNTVPQQWIWDQTASSGLR